MVRTPEAEARFECALLTTRFLLGTRGESLASSRPLSAPGRALLAALTSEHRQQRAAALANELSTLKAVVRDQTLAARLRR